VQLVSTPIEGMAGCCLPVILVSSRRDLAAEATALGVAGHIGKPLDVRALTKLIQRQGTLPEARA
jgi:hypothetical protein